MKDISVRSIPKDAVYKDVVIIGNGPSGISLSYMLAGNWPYWNSEKVEKHPDEILRARLNYADSSQSLVKQDLLTLAEGLEGRSTNPVSLLLDSLDHPCADIGMELPSMLEYKIQPNTQIDHIVLGKGPPGGSWHRMDPNLRTLSLAAWMSLPGLSFSDWETRQLKNELTENSFFKEEISSNELIKQVLKKSVCQKCIELRNRSMQNLQNCDSIMLENNNESESGALCCKCTKALKTGVTKINNKTQKDNTANMMGTYLSGVAATSMTRLEMPTIITDDYSPTNVPPRRNLSLKRQVSKEVQTRALVSRVAQYYDDYVRLMGLENNFMDDTIVTMISPIHVSCPLAKLKNARWLVCGINKSSGKAFYFITKNVVLANGASDLANRLGLRGENLNISWVKHELPQLEAALESYDDEERSRLKPVLIVGAGLSAADAVTICRSSDINVIHVYRSRTAGLDKMLPENVYPEYHEVHKMMKNSTNTYNYYTPLPEHTIIDVSGGTGGVHKVTVQHLTTGEQKTFEVSFCAILIGSRPDLQFASSITKCPSRSLPLEIGSFPCDERVTSPQQQQENLSLLSKKISWLKNMCAKCKHLNLCNRRNDYRKICGHIQGKSCECNKSAIKNEKNQSWNCCGFDETGLGLGIDPSKPIDCKSNQIAVDKYTNEVLRAPKGLFAMGPLVGDNFVRFIPGGALAITATLHKEND